MGLISRVSSRTYRMDPQFHKLEYLRAAEAFATSIQNEALQRHFRATLHQVKPDSLTTNLTPDGRIQKLTLISKPHKRGYNKRMHCKTFGQRKLIAKYKKEKLEISGLNRHVSLFRKTKPAKVIVNKLLNKSRVQSKKPAPKTAKKPVTKPKKQTQGNLLNQF